MGLLLAPQESLEPQPAESLTGTSCHEHLQDKRNTTPAAAGYRTTVRHFRLNGAFTREQIFDHTGGSEAGEREGGAKRS